MSGDLPRAAVVLSGNELLDGRTRDTNGAFLSADLSARGVKVISVLTVADDVERLTAAFRYSLIAPVVSRQTPLLPGELKRYLLETAERSYEAPGENERISVRTLERYLAAYRAGGWEGLKPKPRNSRKPAAIAPETLALAMNLRRERPERSVE